MTRFLFLALIALLASPALAQHDDHATTDLPQITPENHDAVMEDMLGAPKHEIREIGILVYDGVNDLDVMGPRYVLGQIMGARTRLVSVEPGTVTTVMGVQIVPDVAMADVDALDILVVPGGFQGTIQAVYDDAIHDWIRAVDETTTYTAAVCTGGWVLAATGLLEGRQATTNWYRAEEMLAKYGATFTDERFTQDGKYWTSAGVTAGMDMSLAIVQDLFGDAYVQGVMLDMEYDPAPPVVGGTPETTSPEVFQMMQAMYDMGVQPLMEQLEAERAAATPQN
ncbi:MAG: DJ-1/PfpI family protein [Bacteroidota bacterium]